MRSRHTIPGLCLLALLTCTPVAAAQDPAVPVAAVNDNRHAAGQMQDGVLTIALQIVTARWYPDDDGGNSLVVPAVAEAGKAPSVPAPLLRAPAGTRMRVVVSNTLDSVATVYGLHEHPGDGTAGLEVPPHASREVAFAAGAPGTYHYYAITDPLAGQLRLTAESAGRFYEDGALSGAFIVDDPGAPIDDRVWVLNFLTLRPNPIMEGHELLTINGKAWPHTERVTLAEDAPVRWHLVNSTPSEHPMHLHGAYYRVLGVGNENRFTRYAPEQVRTVVTEYVLPGGTFDMEWTPAAPGGWLFHCHYVLHMVAELALPAVVGAAPHEPAAPHAGAHAADSASHGMGGLVLGIDVTPKPPTSAAAVEPARRRVQMTVEAAPAAAGGPAGILTTLHDAATGERASGSPGPPLVVTRGEPLQVDVDNQLDEPTSIHWHGLELDSYYDGVPGIGGTSRAATPAIAPGLTFAARMTPPRAGTFIYHTHMGHETQMAAGLYGPMIVLEPGAVFDAEHDRILLVGAAEVDWGTAEIRLNGQKDPAPIELQTGRAYRLRLINISPNQDVTVSLGGDGDRLQWRAVAKDGFELPEAQRRVMDARLLFSVGETYDFEFVAERAGDFPLVVQSAFNELGRIETLLRVRDASHASTRGNTCAQ